MYTEALAGNLKAMYIIGYDPAATQANIHHVRSAMKKVERGEKVKPEKGLYFESIEGFRKALTTKRLGLLHLIREKQPGSIQELTRLSKRNIKSVATDIAYPLIVLKLQFPGLSCYNSLRVWTLSVLLSSFSYQSTPVLPGE